MNYLFIFPIATPLTRSIIRLLQTDNFQSQQISFDEVKQNLACFGLWIKQAQTLSKKQKFSLEWYLEGFDSSMAVVEVRLKIWQLYMDVNEVLARYGIMELKQRLFQF